MWHNVYFRHHSQCRSAAATLSPCWQTPPVSQLRLRQQAVANVSPLPNAPTATGRYTATCRSPSASLRASEHVFCMSLNRHSHAAVKQLACGHALLRIQTYAGHIEEGGLMSFVHGMWSYFQPSQAANSRGVNPARKKGKAKKAKTAAEPRGVWEALWCLSALVA